MSAPEWHDAEKPLTIAEAAAALAMGERRLRRLLEKPEYAARTVSVTRQTKTGTRQAVTVPAALLVDLKRLVEIETNAANTADASDSDERGQPVEAAPKRGGGTLTRTETLLMQALADRDLQNADMKEQIAFLRAELSKATGTIAGLAAAASRSAERERRPWWERIGRRRKPIVEEEQ